MGYLNDIYPYTRNDAVACFYSYEKSCILVGSATQDKKLIVTDEFNFEEKSINFISEYLYQNYLRISGKVCWINKNPYLANILGECYYLDYTDEQDCNQLEDLFKSLLAENRIIFKYEKPSNSYRKKTLPILIKALSHSIFSQSIKGGGRAIAGGKLKTLHNF
jgi:hypothetical protein